MKFSEKLKKAMQQLGINQAQVVGLTGKSKGSSVILTYSVNTLL